MKQKFNIIIEKGEDGYLLSEVVGLPGCHTQAKTMEELMKRTKESIELHFLVHKEKVKDSFLALSQIEVKV